MQLLAVAGSVVDAFSGRAHQRGGAANGIYANFFLGCFVDIAALLHVLQFRVVKYQIVINYVHLWGFV